MPKYHNICVKKELHIIGTQWPSNWTQSGQYIIIKHRYQNMRNIKLIMSIVNVLKQLCSHSEVCQGLAHVSSSSFTLKEPALCLGWSVLDTCFPFQRYLDGTFYHVHHSHHPGWAGRNQVVSEGSGSSTIHVFVGFQHVAY